MEHSLNSSMGKEVSANENPSYHEESGWTYYLEDFSKDKEPSYCSSFGGSSLLSDAASCAAWKFSHSVRVKDSSNNLPKKLCFKKTRTKHISEDDPLEDTASSPLNSPKVGDLKPMEMVSRKIDDQLDGSRGKGFESKHYPKLKTDESDKIFIGHNNVECTDLKKRGLCLVPLSMLVNYYG